MSLNSNPAVKRAFEERRYTDARGTVWGRGMDGWHDVSAVEDGEDTFVDGIFQLPHYTLIKMIEEENPSGTE